MTFLRYSKMALFYVITSLFVASIGAFQGLCRKSWQPSSEVVYKLLVDHGRKNCLTVCGLTRGSQSKQEEETTFLMKPFSTASGEVVYVVPSWKFNFTSKIFFTLTNSRDVVLLMEKLTIPLTYLYLNNLKCLRCIHHRNPYKILNVSRRAERKEIRDAYRKLSKRYHPDIVRHSKVLPGKW